jgi:prolyl-tRNA synthetase
VVIGDRGLKEGKLEYVGRRDTEATNVPVAEMLAFVQSKLVAA